MVEVQSLNKTFGNLQAVSSVSFRIERGKTLALIGSSGSGKTTILKMINRLVNPDSGKIIINNKDITNQPITDVRRQMGYVIQNAGLFPHYTVLENISVVPNLLKWNKKEINDRAYFLLNHVGLNPGEYSEKYPNQLSGGEKQRVGIARALAGKPSIILMDEPFGALDPITRYHIRQDVLELNEFKNRTKIVVTHDVEEAFEMGDLVCLLDKGVIQQLDTPRKILENPKNKFVKDFFDNQRFQLELGVYRLNDIYQNFTTEKITEHIVSFKSNTTVREAMDTIKDKKQLTGVVRVNEQTYYFNVAGLIGAHQKLMNA